MPISALDDVAALLISDRQKLNRYEQADLVVVKPMWDPFTGISLDFDRDAHDHSARKIFPRLGESATTDEVPRRVTAPV